MSKANAHLSFMHNRLRALVKTIDMVKDSHGWIDDEGENLYLDFAGYAREARESAIMALRVGGLEEKTCEQVGTILYHLGLLVGEAMADVIEMPRGIGADVIRQAVERMNR